MKDTTETISVSVMLPAGRLPLAIMQKAHDLASKHDLEVYLSTAQNLRLLGVPNNVAAEVKASLAEAGATFKEPGKLRLPRICIGKTHCKLGVIDTQQLNAAILDFFREKKVKEKVKIAISGCILSCSGAKTSDLGIIATRAGYDIYVGGKGGPSPKTGIRVRKQVNEEELLQSLGILMDFHDRKTVKKQRMYKLLEEPDFPFQEI